MYQCQTCGETVRGLSAARRHAKQGHRTQRDAYAAGELHALQLVTIGTGPDDVHPTDCGYCAAGEPMRHQYEPPNV